MTKDIEVRKKGGGVGPKEGSGTFFHNFFWGCSSGRLALESVEWHQQSIIQCIYAI
jgi:hypothetical protein